LPKHLENIVYRLNGRPTKAAPKKTEVTSKNTHRKLKSNNKKTVPNNLGLNLEGSVPFVPTWEPYNREAEYLVNIVLELIGYVPAGVKTDAKYRRVVASVLALSSVVITKVDGVLAISKNDKHWAQYSVGKVVILDVIRLLESKGFISFVPDTGQRHFDPDENDKKKWIGILSQYNIDDALQELKGYWDSKWVETGRPAVLIGKPETRGTAINRKKMGIKKPKIPITVVKNTFGRQYSKAVKGVNLLVTYWKDHPLELPLTENSFTPYAACATRIYHNGKLDSGGRYYGAWTNVSSKQRLKGLIDDEPLVEIDLNASQPTLFSSLMGYTMEVENTWSDLYAGIVRNLGDEEESIKRKKIKQAAVEVIGTGNIAKKHPAKDSGVTWAERGEYEFYIASLLSHVPALTHLNTDYYNGAGFISYHEAEIMTETLHTLMSKNVVAYPVHDCLLVKRDDQELALETYRATIRNYVLKFNKATGVEAVDITVPVSIEESAKPKVRISGSYN